MEPRCDRLSSWTGRLVLTKAPHVVAVPQQTPSDLVFGVGFGADYPITDSVSLGSSMLFNFLPDDVVDENFYFSWQVVGVRYRF